MAATISATEWRIRRTLTQFAEQERWPITPLLLGRIAKLAARAADTPRPSDPPPPPAGGRKRGRRPSAGTGGLSGGPGGPGVSEALQEPVVARVASAGPARGPEVPSERPDSPAGGISRPTPGAALTDAPEPFPAPAKPQAPSRAAMHAAIVRRYQAGETIPRLAADSGYTHAQLRGLLQRAGVKLRQHQDGAR